MQKLHLGFLYGLIAALASAGTAIFTKLAVSVPTETMVFIRFAICFLLVLPMCKGKLKFSLASLPKHFLRDLCGLISIYCYFYAVKNLPLVNATSLTNTTPLFLPLVILVWSRLVVSKARFWAAGIGFAGVLIMLRPTPDHFFEWASVAGLGTGLLSAIAFLGIRKLSNTDTTETILFYYFGISTLLSFFPMVYNWHPISAGKLWIYLLAMGILSMIYQFATTKSFTHAPPSKVSSMAYLSIFFGGLAGWAVFDEMPDVWVFVGAALTIVGGILALMDNTPPTKLKS